MPPVSPTPPAPGDGAHTAWLRDHLIPDPRGLRGIDKPQGSRRPQRLGRTQRRGHGPASHRERERHAELGAAGRARMPRVRGADLTVVGSDTPGALVRNRRRRRDDPVQHLRRPPRRTRSSAPASSSASCAPAFSSTISRSSSSRSPRPRSMMSAPGAGHVHQRPPCTRMTTRPKCEPS